MANNQLCGLTAREDFKTYKEFCENHSINPCNANSLYLFYAMIRKK